MTEMLRKEDIGCYEFIRAVDGSLLKPTEELAELFRGNDFGSRRGFVGCALTHMNLWKRLMDDKEHDFYLIIEDDVEPTFKSFKSFKLTIFENIENMRKKDVIMLEII